MGDLVIRRRALGGRSRPHRHPSGGVVSVRPWVGANGDANRVADITALMGPHSNRGALPAYELACALNTRVAAYAKQEGNVANLPVTAAALLEAPHLSTVSYLD